MNPSGGNALEVEAWQIENYREVELENLFIRLLELDIDLDLDALTTSFEEADSPEELALFLAQDTGTKRYEKIYLLVFELWRRLCKEKESLSIFCDELDQQIYKFNNDLIETEEMLDVLEMLDHILDTNADRGVDPKVVFESVCSYLAHDLEQFIYDFIGLQIENQQTLYASELIDHFYPYVLKTHRLDFLRIRCAALLGTDDVDEMIAHLECELENETSLQGLFDVLDFATQYGQSDLFLRTFSLITPMVETIDAYQELLTFTMHYFESVGLAKEVTLLQKMVKAAGKKHPDTDVACDDLDKLLHITLTGVKSM
ncbi:MAG: hypothetical protein P0S94_05230 [Simkaniaceae bacterium]|nr:hypothetical protein [Simkaniaceae bacterium]